MKKLRWLPASVLLQPPVGDTGSRFSFLDICRSLPYKPCHDAFNISNGAIHFILYPGLWLVEFA